MNGLYNYGNFSNRQPQKNDAAETPTPTPTSPNVVEVKIDPEPNFEVPFEKKYQQRGTFYQRNSAENGFQQSARYEKKIFSFCLFH